MHSPTLPYALSRIFFLAPRPLFVQPAGNPVPPSAPRPTSVAPTVTQPDAVNTSQGSSPNVIQSWQEEFMRDMKTCWNQLLVTLHLSQPWVPLFRPRTWAPTRCGSWVPLKTERHHGLSVRPDQNEQTAASIRTGACLPSRPDLHSTTPPRFRRVFRVTRPISPSQPGRTGINLLVTLHLSQPWVPLSVREHGPQSAAAAESLWRPRGFMGSA